MAGAFQNDAFQNDAFQTDSGPPPPPAAGNTSINQWAMGPCGVMTRTCMPSSFVDNAHAQIITYGCLGEDDEPELTLFDNVRFYFPDAAEPIGFQFAQLYFGASGTDSGAGTDQAAFLAAHPGLSLEDFSGIAPPGGLAPVPAMFTGFTQAPGNGGIDQAIFDSALLSLPFCVWVIAGDNDYVELTFSPEVNAVGFNWDGMMTVEFRAGTTVLYTQTSVGGGDITTQFLGYSSGGS